MLVELLRSEDNKVIGWTMKGENPEEIKKLGYIRDMQFWGLNDTEIVYNGRTESDDANNNPGKLAWIQKGHQKK
jgi:hypothetical protein